MGFTPESAVEVLKFTTSNAEFPEYELPEEEAILSKPIFLATRFAANDMTLSSEFAGVDKIEIYFTANRLTNIRVYYSKSEWWRDHDEFRDTVIRKLGLPEQGKYWGGGRAGTLDDGRESYETLHITHAEDSRLRSLRVIRQSVAKK